MVQLQKSTLFGEHDRYQLICLLGQGGYSEVWLAEDKQAGLTIVIKVYAPGKGLDDDGVKVFSKEFSMVFNLNHPNLLRPTHYDVFERMPYLIMPYCEHGSSSKLAGRIDEHTAWKFLHEVASGLAYLHAQEQPVIHQDIKPDNILIDSNDSFLITDFGISSKARSTLRQSMQSGTSGAGTMAYMAPERFSKDNLPIKASDVWALGASLFELMTGEPPFGEHGGLLLKGGAEIPNIPSEEWSPKLKEMVYRCLQKEAWDRPTAQTISEEAKRHIHGKSTTHHVSRKFPVVWTLFLAVALITGLCAGFFAGRRQANPHPKLYDGITYIEQGDSLFNENNLTTWRETLVRYQEARALTDQYSLQLPNMDHRIRQLQLKMDDVINSSIETAKKAFAVRSEMALAALKDALELDPDHTEAKALYEQYIKFFSNSKN